MLSLDVLNPSVTELVFGASGISIRQLLTAGGIGTRFSDIIKSNANGETINWYINDKSLALGESYVQYMTDTVERLDSIIDLDFELVSDVHDSSIDVNLYDYSGQEYAGLCYTLFGESSGMEIIDFSHHSTDPAYNKNTFIHELGHALGLGEPGHDLRWDQEDTAMSYNKGDISGWQTWYTESDLDALIYLWGVEDDGQVDGLPDLNNDGFVDGITNYTMWTASGGVLLTNSRGKTYSDDTGENWDAIRAIQTDSGFSLLIQGSRRTTLTKYKVADANDEGIRNGTTRWFSSSDMFDQGYEDIFSIDFNGNNQIGF